MACVLLVKIVFLNFLSGIIAEGVVLTVKGLVPSVFTPFDEYGQVNLTVVPYYAQYLKDNDIDGVLVAGTSSEGPSLSLDEKKGLLDAWMKAAKPLGLKIVMQVGGAPMPEVLDLAKYAEAVRPDALLTLPELYYRPADVDTLVAYVKRVSVAAPTLPILYYDHPSLSNVKLNMPKFFGLATKAIPNFKGIKCGFITAVDISASNDVNDDQRIFMDSHAVAASASMMGYNSSMSAVSNLFPKLMREIIEAVEDNDVMKAKLLQHELNKKVAVISSQAEYVPSVKAAMAVISGINVGSTRAPIKPLTAEQKKFIYQQIDEMHV